MRSIRCILSSLDDRLRAEIFPPPLDLRCRPKATRPAKILYFVPVDPNGGLGGGARIRNMLEVLAERKVNLIIYTAAHRSTVVKLLTLASILCRGLIIAPRYDIVLVHAPTVVTGFPGLVAAKFWRKPLVVDHMDVEDPQTPKFLYKLILRNSTVVFAISRLLENECRNLGCCKIIYLPVFIDAGVFRPNPQTKLDARQELVIAGNEIVIGYAGSFSPIEGVPYLLRAFKALLARHGNLRLVILGGRNVPDADDVGGLVEHLGLREKVIIVPQQPYELMPRYLSCFDIACAPKTDCRENRAANPIKVYEYMAMALPVVLSWVGEVASIIQNNVDGLLFEPDSESDLTLVLERVIENPNQARKIGEKARDKILSAYTRESMMERISAGLGHCLR